MLPDPTLTFTLPSIHDGTILDCRVFHPYSLSPLPKAPQWQKHAAIVAHPYAPLGGCFDDPVIDIVAAMLLRTGFLVCTFNFRGASGSAGRTSWTAKAERADYMSIVGFVSYYVHFLDPFRRPGHDPAAAPSDNVSRSTPSPVLLLCGYSYGAMITTQLPNLETILATVETPAGGSPAAEIRLRAEHLADAQNTVLASTRAALIDRQTGKSPRKSLGMRIGGDEDSRRSRDSHRSFSFEAEEKIKKGVADLMAKARKGHTGTHPKKPHSDRQVDREQQVDTEVCLGAVPDMTRFRPAYLLVSPLQGIITNLATMSFANPFRKKTNNLPSQSPPSMHPSLPREGTCSHGNNNSGLRSLESEQQLINNPTLAVYGGQDVFVAAKKLREWGARLEGYPNSQFRAHEVPTAGHFWTEDKVIYILRDTVGTFAEGLLAIEPLSPPGFRE